MFMTTLPIKSRILNALGMMTRAEHESHVEVLEDLLAETQAAERLLDERFKKAVSDLASQSSVIENLLGQRNDWKETAVIHAETIASLHPDAEKWRARAAREKARGERRKGRGQ